MASGRESGVLRKVLGACVVIALFSVLCCGGIGLGVHGWHAERLRALAPYQSLTWVVRDGGSVTAQLGEPIRYGRWLNGRHVEETGALELHVPLEGPYSNGSIALFAQLSRGEWEIQSLTLFTDAVGETDLMADLHRLEEERLRVVVLDLVGQAQSHESQGAHVDAVDLYSRALEFDADASQALLGRGRARRNLGDLDGARLDLERHLALLPDEMDGRFELAQVHAAAGRNDLCVAAYTDILRIEPDNAGAWFHRAACFEALGKGRSAAAGAREACRLGHDLACAMSVRLSAKR